MFHNLVLFLIYNIKYINILLIICLLIFFWFFFMVVWYNEPPVEHARKIKCVECFYVQKKVFWSSIYIWMKMDKIIKKWKLVRSTETWSEVSAYRTSGKMHGWILTERGAICQTSLSSSSSCSAEAKAIICPLHLLPPRENIGSASKVSQ